MMITSAELKPVTVGLYGMMSYFNPQYGAVLQGALLGVLPLIALFLGLQRYWQAGLASGAVKERRLRPRGSRGGGRSVGDRV